MKDQDVLGVDWYFSSAKVVNYEKTMVVCARIKIKTKFQLSQHERELDVVVNNREDDYLGIGERMFAARHGNESTGKWYAKNCPKAITRLGIYVMQFLAESRNGLPDESHL